MMSACKEGRGVSLFHIFLTRRGYTILFIFWQVGRFFWYFMAFLTKYERNMQNCKYVDFEIGWSKHIWSNQKISIKERPKIHLNLIWLPTVILQASFKFWSTDWGNINSKMGPENFSDFRIESAKWKTYSFIKKLICKESYLHKKNF